MKTLSLRGLSRDAPEVGEPVWVTHEGSIIGQFVPVGQEPMPAINSTPRVSPLRDDRFGESRPAPKPGVRKK